MTALLSISDLPAGFEYPSEFIRVVELGLTNLEPWLIIGGDLLLDRQRGLRERYRSRSVVPFAIRQDCDDVACFDGEGSGKVIIIHDFASPGWELTAELDDFNAWLRQAIEDLIDWGS